MSTTHVYLKLGLGPWRCRVPTKTFLCGQALFFRWPSVLRSPLPPLLPSYLPFSSPADHKLTAGVKHLPARSYIEPKPGRTQLRGPSFKLPPKTRITKFWSVLFLSDVVSQQRKYQRLQSWKSFQGWMERVKKSLFFCPKNATNPALSAAAAVPPSRPVSLTQI